VVLGLAGFKMLGVEVKGVGGYSGSTEVLLAVQRGELDGGWNPASGYTTNIRPREKEGIFVSLFQSGMWRPEDNSIVSVPGLEHISMFNELHRKIKGTNPSGPLWDAWFAPLISAGRGTVFFPPGVPEQAVAEMRAGFEGMCRDTAYIADMKRVGVNPRCFLGKQARRITERSATTDPVAKRALEAILPRM
jgi:hypothetical protein